jgi:hypothetical protein
MDTGTPLNRLTFYAASVADDLGYVALSDLARMLGSVTDIADIWRCLEIAFAAGIGPEDFAGGVRSESAEVIRSLFGDRQSAPVAALASGQRLSGKAADARLTRIRALIAHVLGSA